MRTNSATASLEIVLESSDIALCFLARTYIHVWCDIQRETYLFFDDWLLSETSLVQESVRTPAPALALCIPTRAVVGSFREEHVSLEGEVGDCLCLRGELRWRWMEEEMRCQA